MTSPTDRTRRALMTSAAGLTLGGTTTADTPATGAKPAPGSSILVAYFSRTGNTRVIAGLSQRAAGADLLEIRPATPYPDAYLATVEQARIERDKGIRPALAGTTAALGNYTTVYLGFPIWGETAPPVIRTFLSSYDTSAKTIIPFITHGGYGLGNSEAVLARHAPKAQMARAFSMEADQERRTMDSVNNWLKKSNAPR